MIQVHISRINAGRWSIRRLGTLRPYRYGTYIEMLRIARRWKASRVYIWRGDQVTIGYQNTKVRLSNTP